MESKIEIGLVLGWGVMFAFVAVIILFSQYYRGKILKSEKEKQIIAFEASIESEEKLKERIANNLHDEIIPLLTALGQNIKQHKKDFYTMNLTPTDFEKDLGIVDQSIKGTRSIALDLIPTTFLNFGLLKAMEQYGKQLNKEGTLVELELNSALNKELPFSKNEQINIYRIYLEILNNLQKHAHFTCLRITIEITEAHFSVQFVHDGKGISNKEIEFLSMSSTGLGLKSLKSRSLILNATINYVDETNVPTIILTIPFKK